MEWSLLLNSGSQTDKALSNFCSSNKDVVAIKNKIAQLTDFCISLELKISKLKTSLFKSRLSF